MLVHLLKNSRDRRRAIKVRETYYVAHMFSSSSLEHTGTYERRRRNIFFRERMKDITQDHEKLSE